MGMGRLGYMTEHAGESLLNLNELLGVSQTNYCVHTEFVLQQAIPNTSLNQRRTTRIHSTQLHQTPKHYNDLQCTRYVIQNNARHCRRGSVVGPLSKSPKHNRTKLIHAYPLSRK